MSVDVKIPFASYKEYQFNWFFYLTMRVASISNFHFWKEIITGCKGTKTLTLVKYYVSKIIEMESGSPLLKLSTDLNLTLTNLEYCVKGRGSLVNFIWPVILTPIFSVILSCVALTCVCGGGLYWFREFMQKSKSRYFTFFNNLK